MTDVPVLWHFSFANYSEKARWALDFKRVPHERRQPPLPGLHVLWAWRIGGGRTMPVLVFGDGEVATDSVQIVAALERRHPDPPLYPSGPADRARAQELDEAFTGELGHHARRIGLDHVRRHPEVALRLKAPSLGPAERVAAEATRPYHAVMRRYFGVTDESVERAWRYLDEAVDRFHASLSPAGYLAGDAFSIADLTFASMLSPIVGPRGFPSRGVPEARAHLADRGVLEWIEDLYARHRGEWLRP